MIVDNAVYVDGVRTEPPSLEETSETVRDRGGFAWIGLYRPSESELSAVAKEFDLPALAVEDALSGHQRAKIEKYSDMLFVVLRPASYVDETEKVEFGEVHVFLGDDFVITVRHFETPDLARVRKRLEGDAALLAHGPIAALYGILDEIVDEYAPVVAGLEDDIDEIEDQLFSGDRGVTRRIYELSTEVMHFQRAVDPLKDVLRSLREGLIAHEADEGLRDRFRDVEDHVIRVTERADGFRQILQNALTVHTALVGRQQNDEVKKISGWAAILFAPTLVGTIYGMNFRVMPELHWAFGYPFALLLMLGMGVGLYVVFKRKGWI
ncbi:magnesium transporter [Leifsonia sp. 98AMF]|uniref:magnesium/cobalt transporter CorA n=1 Tax=unclassified Leifsonia TaxID=2663824 RepID=UPI0003818373|nr:MULTISPECIES: magnesium/cobalt transporter CorA [unclassified Leifsonia]TDP98642.1 magnesium transporter [Leifsonia sp. 115AMFTsu3.1]SDH69634.1 magnesium transporter [Leifsonia sp. 197AMF]SDI70257.1 magnesium transporter [Leifsonia sp. 466MF]SDK20651.1 magnesium transporter [Leifsonia sp. 157MF]SDN72647.1 magnesium transporter [Leifsonia sp. 509MF]